MKNGMFNNVLQKDEKIVFEEGVNKKAFFIKNYLGTLIVCIVLAILATSILTMAIYDQQRWSNPNAHEKSYYFQQVSKICWSVCGVFVISISVSGILKSSNTFFAITDKRIIKRTGILNNKFIHYSLKNIGNVAVNESIFDSKGDNGSATLVITTKDFQSDVEDVFVVTSLNNGYKAYRMLGEKIQGNNEVFRIKNEG